MQLSLIISQQQWQHIVLFQNSSYWFTEIFTHKNVYFIVSNEVGIS